MVFEANVTSPLDIISPQQAPQPTYSGNDPQTALMSCHDTGVALVQSKKVAQRTESQTAIEEITAAIIDFGKLLKRRSRCDEMHSCKSGEKLG